MMPRPQFCGKLFHLLILNFWVKLISDGLEKNLHQPIPRKKLTVNSLAEAIETATTHQEMRQRAAELGRKIQAEDGIVSAVRIINQLG